MNFENFFLFYLFYFARASNNDHFPIEHSVESDSFILSEIITNYLLTYFTNQEIYVSIILPPSSQGNESLFQADFFETFFDDAVLIEFAYNMLHRLDIKPRLRVAFNLLLMDNRESLQ